MRPALVFCFALLVGCSSAPKAETPAPAPPARISLEVESQDLSAAVAEIERLSGQTIVVDPWIEESVSVRLIDVPWREALDVVARMARCSVEERGESLVVTQSGGVTISDVGGGSIVSIVSLIAVYLDKEARIHPSVEGTFPPEVEVVNMPIEYLLSLLSRQSGYTLALTDTLLLCGPAEWVAEASREE